MKAYGSTEYEAVVEGELRETYTASVAEDIERSRVHFMQVGKKGCVCMCVCVCASVCVCRVLGGAHACNRERRGEGIEVSVHAGDVKQPASCLA